MKALKIALVAVTVLLVAAAPVLAQEKTKTPEERFFEKWEGKTPSSQIFSGAGLGAGLGAAFVLIGAGYGFGRIGAAALESMARQPEVAGRIQTAMIVIAALLEGATFFALIVCITLKATF